MQTTYAHGRAVIRRRDSAIQVTSFPKLIVIVFVFHGRHHGLGFFVGQVPGDVLLFGKEVWLSGGSCFESPQCVSGEDCVE